MQAPWRMFVGVLCCLCRMWKMDCREKKCRSAFGDFPQCLQKFLQALQNFLQALRKMDKFIRNFHPSLYSDRIGCYGHLNNLQDITLCRFVLRNATDVPTDGKKRRRTRCRSPWCRGGELCSRPRGAHGRRPRAWRCGCALPPCRARFSHCRGR